MIRATGLALGILVLAVVTLGTHWTGVEVAPGIWRDPVTPTRWVVFGVLLAVLGVATGGWVPQWSRRLIVLVPVWLWLLWELRHGTLWPIAFAIYGGGILVCWLVGCALAAWLRPARAA